ncbi:MAG TPA: DUF4331 domain-containing protein [Thermoanaerobaculia bacterium]|nr:DUF4331 domain-containing protein [Thermoanaerobaculia bacterium]
MPKRFKTLVVAFALSIVPLTTVASSHREAPLITEDQTADNTDVWVFRSADRPDFVTIIGSWIPLQEPGGGPYFYNFSPDAVYEIHIDNNGDAVEDITYSFKFRTENRGDSSLYNLGPITTLDDADWLYRQFYTVTRINGDRRTGSRTTLGTNLPVPPANIGPKSTPDYAALSNAAIRDLTGGGRVFAGPSDDPFFIDFSVFDLLTLRPIQQLHLVPPVSPMANGVDGLRGFNVHTIAIQVPLSAVTNDGQAPGGATAANAIIGVWASTSRPRLTILSAGGDRTRRSVSGDVQVSRLGMPLVNEVVVPTSLKDVFNASEPKDDAQFLPKVLDPELPKLFKILYNVDSPPPPRNDLVQVFLTGIPGVNMPPNVKPSEMIRINLAVAPSASPNRLGVIGGDMAGFPNGRRLVDDIVDIDLRVAAGVLVPAFNRAPNNALTDGVDANDLPFRSAFPYVALPHRGTDSRGRSQNP